MAEARKGKAMPVTAIATVLELRHSQLVNALVVQEQSEAKSSMTVRSRNTCSCRTPDLGCGNGAALLVRKEFWKVLLSCELLPA